MVLALCTSLSEAGPQTGSVVTTNNQQAYTGTGGLFAQYGFEYQPGLQSEGGYVSYALSL